MKTALYNLDTLQETTCKGATCGAKIKFMRNMKTGKRMPFNGDAVAVSTEGNVATMNLDDNHWASCPDRLGFGKKVR